MKDIKLTQLMGCPKCRGGREFFTKGIYAFCCKCRDLLGISCKIKDLPAIK